MNSVSLTGRLTADPVLRATQGDTTVCDMRVAIARRRSREGEDRGAVFIDLTTFGATAHSCAQYLAKGRQIAVSGRLELDEWQTTDGEARRRHKIIGEQIEFLDRPPNSNQREPASVDAENAEHAS